MFGSNFDIMKIYIHTIQHGLSWVLSSVVNMGQPTVG